MNGTFRKLSALALAFSVSMAVSPTGSEGKEKSNAKGNQGLGRKGKPGRKASEAASRTEPFYGEPRSGFQRRKNQGIPSPRSGRRWRSGKTRGKANTGTK